MPHEVMNGGGAPELGRLGSVRPASVMVNVADPTDSAPLTPHERLRELAALLATGVHRLRTNRSASPECGGIPAESPRTGLESVAGSCPTRCGLQRESAEVDDGD